MEEKVAYKMLSSKYLGGHWFIDIIRYAKGWHGEGWLKVEFSLKKLGGKDRLLCALTNDSISFDFESKKFNLDHVKKMEEEIMQFMTYPSLYSPNKTLSSNNEMPNDWFVTLREMFQND